MKVSVIMPAYNAEKYIREAIQSVQNQSCQDWELVIVDDASTDRTNAICRGYAETDARIHLYQRETNGGCPAALNDALQRAEGEYICWLSADDRYEPQMLRRSTEYLVQNPELDAVFCRHAFIDEQSCVIAHYEPKDYEEIGEPGCPEPYWTMVMGGNAFCACTLFGKAAAFHRAGLYDENHPYAGDYEYSMRFCAHAQIGYLDEELMQSRIHGGQVTCEGNNEVDAIAVFEKILFDHDLRRGLFQRAGLEDSLEVMLTAVENRRRFYSGEGGERERELLEELRRRLIRQFGSLPEAKKHQRLVTEQIRELLRQGEVLEIDKLLKTTQYTNREMEIMRVLLQVFRSEAINEVSYSVLDYSQELDTLVVHYDRLKQNLCQLQFGLTQGAGAELYKYCEETGVSDYFLFYVIKHDIRFRRRVCENLALLFSQEEGKESPRARLYREMAQVITDERE